MSARTLRNTANPTMLEAGYKHNVIPPRRPAHVDCRFLPGHEDEFFATIRRAAPARTSTSRSCTGTVAAGDPLRRARWSRRWPRRCWPRTPTRRSLPYCLSGGTDDKALQQLGIAAYGFAPLRLPADLDFAAMFHGIDERVPVDALEFGARVLDRFIGEI